MKGFRQSHPRWNEELLALMAQGKKEVAVGFPAGRGLKARHYPTGASILEVAVWNNFGAPRAHIPARPFMNQSAPKIIRAVNRIARLVARESRRKPLTAVELERSFDGMGQVARDVVKETITNGDFVPNAPSTIRRKHSSRPLIDTTDMRAAVQYAVREKAR